MVISQELVANLYLATMGRTMASAGLDYWTNTGDYDGQNGHPSGTSITTMEGLSASFAAQPEYAALYPAGTTDTVFINQIFQNLFQRDMASSYWPDEIAAGRTTRADAVMSIISGAKGADATILANRAAVAIDMADNHVLTAEVAKSQAVIDALKAITADPASKAAAIAAIQTQIDGGKTFALKTGTDTLVGTDANDTFTGVVSNLASEKTLNPTDSIDGGKGEDIFNVTMKANFTGLTGNAKIQNVETIALTNDSTITRTFDNSGITGVTKYTIDATKAAINLTDMATKADIDLSNQASGTFSTKFATGAAELTGTTDSIKLGLSSVGTVEDKATTATEEKTVTITLTDIETANVTATGDNVVSFGGTDLTALNIEGAGNIKVASSPTSLKTVDASSATGKVDVDVTKATAIASVKTGKGDDTITIKADNSLANATISGADGADTLSLYAVTAQTVQYQMTGVETVALGTVGAALTFSGAKASDITTISTKSTVTAAADFVGMGSANLTFNALGATVVGGNVSIDNTGTTVVNYTADAASVTAKTAQTSDADFTLSNSSEVTVNVGEYINAKNSDITVAKATAVTLNVASGKDSATTPAELTKFGGTIKADKATSIIIDAKGKLDTATINAAEATSANITNGSTAATLALTTAKLEELTLVSDSSFDASSSTFKALQTASVTMNNGTFTATGEDMAKLSTLTVTGAGTSSTLVESTAKFGNLGGDNSYALTVTAEGLKGGLTIGTMNASKGQSLTVDATKVTGDITLGNIGASASASGANVDIKANGAGGTIDIGTIGASTAGGASSVTVNTAGATKAVTIGAITSTGAVDVNFKGNLDKSTVGAITGKSVTIDAGDSLKDVTIGADSNNTADIHVTNSLTYTAGLKDANSSSSHGLEIETDKDATATTFTLNGGIGDDAFAIQAKNTSAATLTVKGDLGVGADQIIVSGSNSDGSSSAGAAITIDATGLKGSEITTLIGSKYDDTIKGSAGVDYIGGMKGADTITGGDGKDIFIFQDNDSLIATKDTITDFKSGDDKILLSFDFTENADALKSGSTNSWQATDTNYNQATSSVADFTAAQTAANSLLDGTVKVAFQYDNTNGYLFFDNNADGTADEVVVLTGIDSTEIANTDILIA